MTGALPPDLVRVREDLIAAARSDLARSRRRRPALVVAAVIAAFILATGIAAAAGSDLGRSILGLDREVRGTVAPPKPCSRQGIYRGRDFRTVKEATETLPGFAGISVDGGCIVVGLVKDTPVPRALKSVNQDDLRIYRTRWSLVQLTDAQNRIVGDRAWLERQGIDLEQVGVNLLENRVELLVSSVTPEIAASASTKLALRYGEQVQLDSKVKTFGSELVAWDAAVVSKDDRSITVSWLGGDGACGGFDHATATETDTRVVVAVYGRTKSVGACTWAGYNLQATVELKTPIGNRTIIDAVSPLHKRYVGKRNATLADGVDRARRAEILQELQAIPWVDAARWVAPIRSVGDPDLTYPGYIAIDYSVSKPGNSVYDFIRRKIAGVDNYSTPNELRQGLMARRVEEL